MSDTYSTGVLCLFHRLQTFSSGGRDFDMAVSNNLIETLLSLVAPKRNEHAQSVRGGLAFMLSRELQKLPRYTDKCAMYSIRHHKEEPPQLDLTPGEFVILSNHENGIAASETRILNDEYARVVSVFDSENPASDVAELIDAATSHPVEGVPLATRTWPPVKKHVKGRGIALLAPSSLLFISNDQPLYLFLIWVSGSVYLMWHPDPELIPLAVARLNSGNKQKRLIHTIGYSLMPLLDDIACVTFLSTFDRMCDRWVKFDKDGTVKTGQLIPKLLHHLRISRASWIRSTREDLSTHIMLMENSNAVSD